VSVRLQQPGADMVRCAGQTYVRAVQVQSALIDLGLSEVPRIKEDVHQWCRQLKQKSGWTQYPECINSAKQLLIEYIDAQQRTASSALVPAAAAAVTPTRATLEIADQPNKRQKVDYTRCVDCSESYMAVFPKGNASARAHQGRQNYLNRQFLDAKGDKKQQKFTDFFKSKLTSFKGAEKQGYEFLKTVAGVPVPKKVERGVKINPNPWLCGECWATYSCTCRDEMQR
jgi:hypothetical protein